MIDLIAVASTQEVILTSTIHTSTANAAPSLLRLVRSESVFKTLRHFRPEQPLSNGIDLVPFVLVFEFYFVGIVLNVHVMVNDGHYPRLVVSGAGLIRENRA